MIHYDATNNVNLKIPDKDKHYESLVKRCADADQVADYREKRVYIYSYLFDSTGNRGIQEYFINNPNGHIPMSA